MTALHSDPTIAARQRWMGVLARARREGWTPMRTPCAMPTITCCAPPGPA